MNLTKAINRAWFVARRTRFILRRGKATAEDQTLFATGGWELFSRVHTPLRTEGPLPAVLIVPGLGASTASTEGFSGPIQVGELCQLGIVFSPQAVGEFGSGVQHLPYPMQVYRHQ